MAPQLTMHGEVEADDGKMDRVEFAKEDQRIVCSASVSRNARKLATRPGGALTTTVKLSGRIIFAVPAQGRRMPDSSFFKMPW
jgi:hypothetical protein